MESCLERYKIAYLSYTIYFIERGDALKNEGIEIRGAFFICRQGACFFVVKKEDYGNGKTNSNEKQYV